MSDTFLTVVDDIDRRILELLMENARTPARQIGIKLRNEGHSIQDRAVAYRIQRLEKKQIIKGYETVLRQSIVEDFEALYLRFKTAKSTEDLIDQVCNFVKDLPNCLMTAT
ncbi:MAG TPA: AsnC family transcriptional regulator, partial [Candidatus Nitrosotalea sp.]|nr:AsnC family transcriptional regulator [Candidatus Nitrosotalea sp.]